jgi:hypothetical protein
MRVLIRLALVFFLGLLLTPRSFADDKDKKDRSTNPARSTAVGVADDGAGSTSNLPRNTSAPAKPAAKPQSSSSGDDSENVPKWIPMPALDGNPGLFTLETGDLLPAGAFDLSIGVNKFSRMPGSITVLQTVPSFGLGFNRWISVFFQMNAAEHIHVDTPSQLSLNNATLGFHNTATRFTGRSCRERESLRRT